MHEIFSVLQGHPTAEKRTNRLVLSRLRQAWRKVDDLLEEHRPTNLSESDKDAPLPDPTQKELRKNY